jgi:hypothetical protein
MKHSTSTDRTGTRTSTTDSAAPHPGTPARPPNVRIADANASQVVLDPDAASVRGMTNLQFTARLRAIDIGMNNSAR